MTTLFISHTPEDTSEAETLGQKLEARGYSCERHPNQKALTPYLDLRTDENAILRCATLLVIWNAQAVQTSEIAQHLRIAHQFKKPVVFLASDDTPVSVAPDMPAATVLKTSVQHEILPELLLQLPALDSQDALILLGEKAAHEYIRDRRIAIDLAKGMLERQEHCEEALAILSHLAQRDLMPGIRESAQEVLDKDRQTLMPVTQVPATPVLNPQDQQYMLGVRCKACQHITYVDRRRLCHEKQARLRKRPAGSVKESDPMDVACSKCGHMMLVHVNCEGL